MIILIMFLLLRIFKSCLIASWKASWIWLDVSIVDIQLTEARKRTAKNCSRRWYKLSWILLWILKNAEWLYCQNYKILLNLLHYFQILHSNPMIVWGEKYLHIQLILMSVFLMCLHIVKPHLLFSLYLQNWLT